MPIRTVKFVSKEYLYLRQNYTGSYKSSNFTQNRWMQFASETWPLCLSYQVKPGIKLDDEDTEYNARVHTDRLRDL